MQYITNADVTLFGLSNCQYCIFRQVFVAFALKKHIMWYRGASWLRYAGSRSEFLQSLGVPDDVIAYVESQEPQTANILATLLKKNPVEDIVSLQSKLPKPKGEDTMGLDMVKQKATSRLSVYPPQFRAWGVTEVSKLYKQMVLQGTRSADEINQYVNTLLEDARHIADWWSYMQREYGDRFVLAQYSFAEASRLSEAWHDMMANLGSGHIYEPTAKGSVEYRFDGKNKGWTIQRVYSKNDHLVEGHLMNHCVGDYANNSKRGDCQIYSLRDPMNRPHVSIEIGSDGSEVRQIFGNSNSDPKHQYKEMIKEWFNDRGGVYRDGSGADFSLRGVDEKDYGNAIREWMFAEDEYGLPSGLQFSTGMAASEMYRRLLDAFQSFEGGWSSSYQYGMQYAAEPLVEAAVKLDTEYLQGLAEAGKTITKEEWDEVSQVKALWTTIWRDIEEAQEIAEEDSESEDYGELFSRQLDSLPYGFAWDVNEALHSLRNKRKFRELEERVVRSQFEKVS
jgi:hypothetical protein